MTREMIEEMEVEEMLLCNRYCLDFQLEQFQNYRSSISRNKKNTLEGKMKH